MTTNEMRAALRQALALIGDVHEALWTNELPPTEPPPPESPPTTIDFDHVKWLHADVSDWRETSKITSVTITEERICIDHTKAGKWPAVSPGGDAVEGNPWVFVRIGGTWYAATYEWLRPGQKCKAMGKPTDGPICARLAAHTKREPIESWRPARGELVGFMVSTLARDSRRTTNERSNVVLVEWSL